MRNKLFIITFIVLFSVLSLKAQVNLGSPYSRFGIGDIETLNIGRSNGMGGIALGLRLPFEINPSNPASYSAIPNKIFLFQSGFKAKRTDYSVTDNSVTDYDFKLNSINAALSVNKFWGMSFGMNPISTVSYNIITSDSVTSGDYTSHFNNKYAGEGGITEIYFGNAFVYKGLSLGVNASYLFGPLLNRTESSQNEQAYSSYVFNLTNTKVKDFHFRYGIQYTDSLFKKYSFTIGGFYENKTDLKAIRTRYVSRTINPASDFPLSDTIVNDTLTDGTIQIPMAYGVGFSFMTKQFIFGLDYKKANWNDVLFFNEKPSSLTNSSSVNFGIEYTNDYSSKQFVKTINWRFGGHYTNSELILNNTQIKDVGLNFGIGIPTKLGAKLNFGFEIGKKGTTENNLLKENYYLINFNINLTDRWFIRRRFF